MIHLNDVAAIAVVCGAIAALSFRDARLVAAGLFVALAASPLASSPATTAAGLALRVLGALFAAYLLRAACLARSVESEGSGIGLPGEIALAGAAFIAGWWIAPVAPLAGSLSAQAAGVSLLALAVVPLAGRNALRAGLGLTAGIVAFTLLYEAWVGPASPVQQLVSTVLILGVVWATSMLASPVAEVAVSAPAEAAQASQAAQANDGAEVVEPAEPPMEPVITIVPAASVDAPAEVRPSELAPELAAVAPELAAAPAAPTPARVARVKAARPAAPARAARPAAATSPGKKAGPVVIEKVDPAASQPEPAPAPARPAEAARPVVIRTVGARDTARAARLRVDLPPAVPAERPALPEPDESDSKEQSRRGISPRDQRLRPRDPR